MTYRTRTPDYHSLGNPNQIRVRHARLNLVADFDKEQLRGSVLLLVKRQRGCPADAPLVLDTKNLDISAVSVVLPGGAKVPASYRLDTARSTALLGTPLVIEMPEGVKAVSIEYNTTEGAEAVKWLPPAAAGKHKFLFTQSQAIMARSWIPLQDSPGVRMTYEATITTPPGVIAAMSAKRLPSAEENVFRFNMPYPIPSYLIALVVGELAYRTLGQRTGIYAQPDVIDAAAWEFAEAEDMLKKVERRYGPYRWGRWDILVLPASFPFGGMENPMLTFVTPTLLAGDRSLVSVLVHELAHSWSGNLVTNATWPDFWLNEGFTNYIERRIVEDLYGVDYADMQVVLGEEDLDDALAELPPADQILHIDLRGRDPDEAVNAIAYEKGALFNRVMEQTFGRKRWDAFVRGYFNHFAFQSITTQQFVNYLQRHLLKQHPRLARRVDIHEWLYKPGLPAHERHTSRLLAAVEKVAADWSASNIQAGAIETKRWSAHEWLRFLRALPKLSPTQMAELDKAFDFTSRTNAEIAFQWLLLSVRNNYRAADSRLESFLATVGRRKFVLPLYKELLAKTPEGKARAQAIYDRSRHFYHFLVTRSVEEALSSAK